MKFFSTPAWSFTSRPESQLFKGDDSNPGPGAYDLRAEEIKVPAPVFGQAKRQDLFQKSCAPGPPPAPEVKPKESKSSKTLKPAHFKEKLETIKVSQPDRPNDDPKKPKTTIAYSFGNKVYSIQGGQEASVGPGQYDPNFKAVQTSRGTTFGVKHESKSKVPNGSNGSNGSNGPGPGAYEVRTERASSVAFGKGLRSAAGDAWVPGPNQYNISRELNSNGKSLTSRRPLPTNKDKMPGPGAYDLRNCFSSPAFAVVSGKRTNFIQPGNNPGPGEYDPGDARPGHKGISFTKGLRPSVISENKSSLVGSLSERDELERKGLIIKEKCHGKIETIDEDEARRLEDQRRDEKPAKNYFDKIGEAPKVSFSGRRHQTKVTPTPGPGQYDVCDAYAKGVKIGTGNRASDLRTFRNRNPGPGAYSASYLPKGGVGGWSFGKDPRSKTIDDDEPGPGHYDIPPVVPDVPKYLIIQSNLNLND